MVTAHLLSRWAQQATNSCSFAMGVGEGGSVLLGAPRLRRQLPVSHGSARLLRWKFFAARPAGVWRSARVHLCLRGKARWEDTVKARSGLGCLHGSLSRFPFPFLPFGGYIKPQGCHFCFSTVRKGQWLRANGICPVFAAFLPKLPADAAPTPSSWRLLQEKISLAGKGWDRLRGGLCSSPVNHVGRGAGSILCGSVGFAGLIQLGGRWLPSHLASLQPSLHD